MNPLSRTKQQVIARFHDVQRRLACLRLQRRLPHFVIRPKTTDSHVVFSVFVEEEFKLPFTLNQEPTIILDGGAYTGISGLYFLEHYPQARVIAVEPEAGNFAQMQHNLAPYSDRATLVNTALWSDDSLIEVYNRHDNDWARFGFATRAVTEPGPNTLTARSIPSLMAECSLDHIDILKLDIEGAEGDIFAADDLAWLDRVNVVIIELHERYVPGSSAVVRAAFDPAVWREYKVGEKVVFARESVIAP